MATHDSTPPVLRFALRVLDAASTDEIARACVSELVEGFGAVRATVLDEHGMRESAGGSANSGGRTAMISLRLSGPEEPPIRLELEIDHGPDLGIVRQQFLDLVGVARRAWTRMAQLERERSAARRDVLTGLENRRAMAEAIDTAWLESRHSGRPMSVMVVDLDHFKLVNDTLGHEAGDEVLQLAGACLVAHLRPGDRVCRWGGDEFLVLVPGVRTSAAIGIADRLRNAFGNDPRARGATMTIGVADTESLPPGETSAMRLVAIADESLLVAKRSGRNRTVAALAYERTG